MTAYRPKIGLSIDSFRYRHPRSAILTIALLLGISLALPAVAQDEKKQNGKNDKDNDKDKIKSYDEVITEDAQTQVGLFRAHRIDEKVLYEIPPDAMSKDLLWVTQIDETTAGHSYAGMPVGNRVVRWEQRGEKILLRDVRYGMRADSSKDSIGLAVKESNLAPIIRVFDVKAYGTDKAPVIDVTDLFKKGAAEFSAEQTLNAGSKDSGRTFIESVKAFPDNIEVKVLATFATKKPKEARSSGITATVHHSMVRLPEDPMTPRRYDERVGYFRVNFNEFGDNPKHQVETIRYITRWRLEKKAPDAEVSEPVEPIVFYVGREVPAKWKPFVKDGIEMWQPAFRKAGFKNAIVGKYAPDERTDPDWDPEDARISTIRWLPSTTENAFGPHVHDPRTGEILEADIRMFHNVQKLVRDWYFVQASPNDEKAQELPMPDDLMGKLIRFVVAHEVGHSLGFPHNMKASSAYTVEQLRDPQWTKKNGTAPSIMDYARFNYVAQPGDGAALMPKIGPYDHFAVNWGYREFPEDADVKAELEALLKQQIDNPLYRFGSRQPNIDSTRQTEDLGSDAVKATRLGLKNLKRVAGYVVEATSEEGESYEQLDNMYGELIAQWRREMGHVVNVVGGVEKVNLYYGDAEKRFFPNDPEYQRKAAQFLIKHALTTPKLFLSEDILSRITAEGAAERILNAQRSIIQSLVAKNRLNRLAEHAQGMEGERFTPYDLLRQLRKGIFSEFRDEPVDINLFRRNLQRAYVEHLASLLKSRASDSDLPALAQQELRRISDLIHESSIDEESVLSAHLLDLQHRIDEALDVAKDDD